MDNPVLWLLISLQVLMGAFDTLYHHEGTERLAWKPSQKNELRLHGIRNLFYALIFICFGWFEPHGIFTIILTTILTIEIFITLWDFVEEDLTRKLPASERINHTLLAINYGAILALAGPQLYAWSLEDSAIISTSYGLWSWFACFSAMGVGLFGIRDILAASRSERLLPANAGHLVSDLIECKRVLITGGTGFIGTRLVEALVAEHHQVTILTRDKSHTEALACPARIITDLEQIHEDEMIDVIINLAGDPVANSLWSERKRKQIITSRVNITNQIIQLINRLQTKPECLINGSAIGWYGLHEDKVLSETSKANNCFVHNVCDIWEKEAKNAEKYGVRVVTMRLGLVLGVEGGMLTRFLTPFEFGLGAVIGTGKQWMSWIALDDVIRMISFMIEDTEINGPVNVTAPNPVRNEVFTSILAKSLNRVAVFRIPSFLLKLVLGDLARETMLGGQKVLPTKIVNAGFRFLHGDLEGALGKITGAKRISDKEIQS